jgi:hypothetical protein
MAEHREALLIACDEFADPKYKRLSVPVSDARALAKLLSDSEIGQFSVELLENEQRDVVSDKLEAFFEKGRHDDVLLLYFAGHGDLDDRGNFYFVARNTKSDRLRSSGISDRFIHETMVRSSSKRQILMLDCCYSGAFSKEWISRGDVGIKQKLTGEGRVVLTASDAIEFAYEKREPSGAVKSLFTSRIIEGIDGGLADLDGDGLISVDELYKYVEERIRSEDPAQRPLKSGSVHGQLWLSRAVPRKDAIPRSVLDLLQHNYFTVRLAGIDELERLISLNKDVLYPAATETLTKLLSDDNPTVKRVAESALRRLEAERLEKERLEAERLEKERLEAERLEKERLEAERLEKERLEAERLEKERLEAERLEKERLEAERLEKEHSDDENPDKQRPEAERLEKERLDAERSKQQLEVEQRENDRVQGERWEKQRLASQQREKERVAAEERERERIIAERRAKTRNQAAYLEKQRWEAQQRETERLHAEGRQREEEERTKAEQLKRWQEAPRGLHEGIQILENQAKQHKEVRRVPEDLKIKPKMLVFFGVMAMLVVVVIPYVLVSGNPSLALLMLTILIIAILIVAGLTASYYQRK